MSLAARRTVEMDREKRGLEPDREGENEVCRYAGDSGRNDKLINMLIKF